jgi:hypothetical protein
MFSTTRETVVGHGIVLLLPLRDVELKSAFGILVLRVESPTTLTMIGGQPMDAAIQSGSFSHSEGLRASTKPS